MGAQRQSIIEVAFFFRAPEVELHDEHMVYVKQVVNIPHTHTTPTFVKIILYPHEKSISLQKDLKPK